MKRRTVLMLASVASMIDQFNMPNIALLQEMGYEVHVACNFHEGNTCDAKRLEKLKHTLSSMHVVWCQWDCPRDVASIKKCCNAYRQLLRLFQEHDYAWIHCHSPVGGALARIAAGPRNIRVAYTAHGFHFYKGAPLRNWMLYYPAEKILAHWTDVLVTVNGEDYRFAKKHLRAGGIFRIPGVGIDTAGFAGGDGNPRKAFRMRHGIPQDAVLLLSVGELNEGKNHRTVLDAMAGLRDQNVYYLVCGQGMLRERLLLHAAGLGIAERVRMLGYVEDVAAAYLAADLFVFPSRREGMPVALMEAMAAGLPCAVSDIRGNRELVTERRLRFHPGCPDELAEILDALIADKNLCRMYGGRNRHRIQKYDVTVVKNRMEKIYGSLAHSSRRR